MKVNVGCGPHEILNGYVNVDAAEFDCSDYIQSEAIEGFLNYDFSSLAEGRMTIGLNG